METPKYFVVIPGFTYEQTGPLQIDAIELSVAGELEMSYPIFTNDIKYDINTTEITTLENNVVCRVNNSTTFKRGYDDIDQSSSTLLKTQRFPYDDAGSTLSLDNAPFGFFKDVKENNLRRISINTNIKDCAVQDNKHHDGLFFIGLNDLADYLTLKLNFYVKLPEWDSDEQCYRVNNYTGNETDCSLNDFALITTKVFKYRPLGKTKSFDDSSKFSYRDQMYDITMDTDKYFDFKLDDCITFKSGQQGDGYLCKYDASTHSYEKLLDNGESFHISDIHKKDSNISDLLTNYSYPQWAIFKYQDHEIYTALPLLYDETSYIVTTKKYGNENGNLPLLQPSKTQYTWNYDKKGPDKAALEQAAAAQRIWLNSLKNVLGLTASEMQNCGILASNIDMATSAYLFQSNEKDINDRLLLGAMPATPNNIATGLGENIFGAGGALSCILDENPFYTVNLGNTNAEIVQRQLKMRNYWYSGDGPVIPFHHTFRRRQRFNGNTLKINFDSSINRKSFPFFKWYADTNPALELNRYASLKAFLDVMARRLASLKGIWTIDLLSTNTDRDNYFKSSGKIYSFTPMKQKKGTVCYLYNDPLKVCAQNYGTHLNWLVSVNTNDKNKKSQSIKIGDMSYVLSQTLDAINNPADNQQLKSNIFTSSQLQIFEQNPLLGFGSQHSFVVGDVNESDYKSFLSKSLDMSIDKDTWFSALQYNFYDLGALIGLYLLVLPLQTIFKKNNVGLAYYANNSRILVDGTASSINRYSMSDYGVSPLIYWGDFDNDSLMGIFDDRADQNGITLIPTTIDLKNNLLYPSDYPTSTLELESENVMPIDYFEPALKNKLLKDTGDKKDYVRLKEDNQPIPQRSLVNVGPYYLIPAVLPKQNVAVFEMDQLEEGQYVLNANVAGETLTNETWTIEGTYETLTGTMPVKYQYTRTFTNLDTKDIAKIWVRKTINNVKITYSIGTNQNISKLKPQESIDLHSLYDLNTTPRIAYRNCGMFKFDPEKNSLMESGYETELARFIGQLSGDVIVNLSNTELGKYLVLPGCINFDDFGACYDKEYKFTYLPGQPWFESYGRFKVHVPLKQINTDISKITSLISKDKANIPLVEDQSSDILRVDGEMTFCKTDRLKNIIEQQTLKDIRKYG